MKAYPMRPRTRLLVGVAVCLLMGACGSPATPSLTNMTPKPAASTTGPPSASSDLTEVTPPYRVATIPASAIHRILLPPDRPQIHRLSGDGSQVVFDELGFGGDAGQGRTIWLADLASGSLTALATSENADAAWTPIISGGRVAWVEWHYADGPNLRGDLTWRVELIDLETRTVREVQSGVSPAGVGGAGGIPLIALTPDWIAVAAPKPTGSNPGAWQTVVRGLPTLGVAWTVTSAEWMYSLALGSDALAFSEGKNDAVADFVYDTRLMVARSSGAPVEIARDAFEVVANGNLMAWVSDPGSSQGHSGQAVAPRIFETSLDQVAPWSLSEEPNGDPVTGSSWPATGDGIVTWADNQDSSLHPDPGGDHLVAWSAGGGVVQLEPTSGMLLSTVGGGWVTWYDAWNSPPQLYGVRLEDLPG